MCLCVRSVDFVCFIFNDKCGINLTSTHHLQWQVWHKFDLYTSSSMTSVAYIWPLHIIFNDKCGINLTSRCKSSWKSIWTNVILVHIWKKNSCFLGWLNCCDFNLWFRSFSLFNEYSDNAFYIYYWILTKHILSLSLWDRILVLSFL